MKNRLLYLPVGLLFLAVLVVYYPRFARRKVSQPDLKSKSLKAALDKNNNNRRLLVIVFVLLGFALFVVMHIIAVFVLDDPSINKEPLTFYEGISVWPAEALRFFAGGLSLFLIYWGTLRLKHNQLALTGWFFPEYRKGDIPVPKFRWHGRYTLYRIFACDLLPKHSSDGRLDAKAFWRECMFHSSLWPRMIRTAFATLIFYALSISLMLILRFPHVPFRGDFSKYVDTGVVLGWSIPLFLFLTFFVVDATLLCKRFIATLSERHTDWPPATRYYFGACLGPSTSAAPTSSEQAATSAGAAQTKLSDNETTAPPVKVEEAYDDWIDIRLIAERTAVVGKLVYYPLIILLLMLFARSALFDNWDWPAGLIFTLALSFVIVISCAFVLRFEAEHAREIALAKVTRRLLVVKGEGTGSATLASQLEFMLKSIEEMRDGAFASITQQPVVRALMILFSASGLVLLEYFGVISL